MAVRHPMDAVGLPGIAPSGQLQFSSLTVARQREIFTRFPVFAERQRRAYRKKFERTGKLVKGIYREDGAEVKSGRIMVVVQFQETGFGSGHGFSCAAPGRNAFPL
jgi:hypothetical protein